MDDTQRLDALGEYGLCISGQYHYDRGEWKHWWRCHFDNDKVIERPTIREVIDEAVRISLEGRQ